MISFILVKYLNKEDSYSMAIKALRNSILDISFLRRCLLKSIVKNQLTYLAVIIKELLQP